MMNTLNIDTGLSTLGLLNNDYPLNLGGTPATGKEGLIIQASTENAVPHKLQTLESPRTTGKPLNTLLLDEKLQDSSNTTGASNILKLIHEMYLQMRKEAAETKNSEYQLKWTAMDAAADKMEVAAHKELTAAIVTGAITMAGGLYAMRAGSLAVKNTKAASDIQMKLDNPKANFKEAEIAQFKHTQAQLTVQATRESSTAFAAGQVGSGMGQMLGAPFTHSAALDRADKERLDADAVQAQAHIDAEADFVRSLTEGTKSIRDFIEQLAAAREKVHAKIVS